jgi:hypothetical protein
MRLLVLPFLLLSSACAGGPVGYGGPTTRPRADAHACALEQLEVLGYMIEDDDREAGTVRATRQLPGVVASVQPGQRHFSQIEVTVAQEAGDRAIMRAIPTMLRETGVRTPFGWSTIQVIPDREGINDANVILLRCGVPETSIERSET